MKNIHPTIAQALRPWAPKDAPQPAPLPENVFSYNHLRFSLDEVERLFIQIKQSQQNQGE